MREYYNGGRRRRPANIIIIVDTMYLKDVFDARTIMYAISPRLARRRILPCGQSYVIARGGATIALRLRRSIAHACVVPTSCKYRSLLQSQKSHLRGNATEMRLATNCDSCDSCDSCDLLRLVRLNATDATVRLLCDLRLCDCRSDGFIRRYGTIKLTYK